MSNFYDGWLNLWDEEQEERRRARTFIHEEDLEWVRTKQDHRAVLLCTRENGFTTSGVAMLAEIPKRWNTGKHSHGEEAIYIVEGEGCSVVDDKRYDWEAPSCLFMPYGSVHQHFNIGEGKVRYFSAMAVPLERFAGLAKFMQYEEAAETPLGKLEGVEKAETDIHPEYGRIVLGLKDAPVLSGEDYAAFLATKQDEFHLSMAKEMRTAGMPGQRGGTIRLMQENDFKAREVEFTDLLIDAPGKHGGKHAHMEALLYVLQGEGYSIIDGVEVPWKKGTLLHVQGPQTVHQHFTTGNIESHQLRIHYGLRSQYFQKIVKRVFPYVYYEFREPL